MKEVEGIDLFMAPNARHSISFPDLTELSTCFRNNWFVSELCTELTLLKFVFNIQAPGLSNKLPNQELQGQVSKDPLAPLFLL